MCGNVCLGWHLAHGDCDCCESMHACACLCVVVHKGHCHCDCCEAMHACVHACVYVCTRRMLTLIAARRCIHVWECVFGLVKAHGHCDCCEAMHACACLCMNKARTHMGLLRGDACMYASVFGLVQAYSHCDCCEAMHACVGMCVWACTRHMCTLIAARRCMRVLVVCCCALGACLLRLLRGDACVCWSVCLRLYKVHGDCDGCKAMHVCACLFVVMH